MQGRWRWDHHTRPVEGREDSGQKGGWRNAGADHTCTLERMLRHSSLLVTCLPKQRLTASFVSACQECSMRLDMRALTVALEHCVQYVRATQLNATSGLQCFHITAIPLHSRLLHIMCGHRQHVWDLKQRSCTCCVAERCDCLRQPCCCMCRPCLGRRQPADALN